VKADSTRITTTLYDVIATMHTMVGGDEDALVVMAIDHLFREGRVTFVENIDPLDERLP
jgi:hypothetical protein